MWVWRKVKEKLCGLLFGRVLFWWAGIVLRRLMKTHKTTQTTHRRLPCVAPVAVAVTMTRLRVCVAAFSAQAAVKTGLTGGGCVAGTDVRCVCCVGANDERTNKQTNDVLGHFFSRWIFAFWGSLVTVLGVISFLTGTSRQERVRFIVCLGVFSIQKGHFFPICWPIASTVTFAGAF